MQGKAESQYRAQQMIYQKLQEQESMGRSNGEPGGQAPSAFSVEVEVPGGSVGRLIGKGGSRIREISQTSNARLSVRGEVGGPGRAAQRIRHTQPSSTLSPR